MIEEIKAQALSRYYNNKWLNGKKGNILVGSYEKTHITKRKDNCFICSHILYFHDNPEDNLDLMEEDIKPICISCVLELDKNENILNKEQREMLARYLI